MRIGEGLNRRINDTAGFV